MHTLKLKPKHLALIATIIALSFVQSKADNVSFSYVPKVSSVNDSLCLAESQDFQNHMNDEFKNKETSPLTKKDLRRFKSLDFFNVDPKYRVVADFKHTPDQPIFEMPTTTERKPKYRKYGEATFVLFSDTITLNVYQNINLITKAGYEDYLFLPFKDMTNGEESYGGGRYLDLRIPEENKLVLNFNKAYNPYCAYNHKYSCPIPPQENHLNIRIPAGVKTFKAH